MARKRKPKDLSPNEQLRAYVNGLLTTSNITPWQVLCVARASYMVMRTGVYEQALDAILAAFQDQGNPYLSMEQMAALRGRDRPIWPDDAEHLMDPVTQ